MTMFCYLTKEHVLNAKRLFFGATGMIGMFLIKGLQKVGFYINWTAGD